MSIGAVSPVSSAPSTASAPAAAAPQSAEEVLMSPAGLQVIRGIVNSASAGIKESLEGMNKWGEEDEDEPDPDAL
jgi:hypothetical protein